MLLTATRRVALSLALSSLALRRPAIAADDKADFERASRAAYAKFQAADYPAAEQAWAGVAENFPKEPLAFANWATVLIILASDGMSLGVKPTGEPLARLERALHVAPLGALDGFGRFKPLALKVQQAVHLLGVLPERAHALGLGHAPLEYLLVDLHRVVVVGEGRLAHEHLIHEDAERPPATWRHETGGVRGRVTGGGKGGASLTSRRTCRAPC